MSKLILITLSILSINVFALNPGDIAPDFTLMNQDGKKVSLSDFKNKYIK